MAVIPVIPTVIPLAFAANGDKATLPVEAQTTGRASFTEGFSPKTSLPETDGGVPPARTDFNAILNILSEHAIWSSQGGGCTWSATKNFTPPCLVHGSDGNIYRCVASSGPDVTGVGAKDPTVVGNTSYWRSLASVSSFGGSSASSGGSKGLVPAPNAGDQNKYLKGDGTWASVAGYTPADPIILQSNITTSWIGSSAPYTQTIAVTGVKTNSIVDVSLPPTASSEQVEAYQALNWTDGGQTTNSITLKAWGTPNNIVIPITVVVH